MKENFYRQKDPDLDGSMISSRPRPKAAIVHVEDVWKLENNWYSGLFQCGKECNKCCCACLCYPCFLCYLYRKIEETSCLCCLLPCGLISARAKIRMAFRINGSLCSDCCASTCCPVCVAVQIDSEIDAQSH